MWLLRYTSRLLCGVHSVEKFQATIFLTLWYGISVWAAYQFLPGSPDKPAEGRIDLANDMGFALDRL